MAHDSIWSLQNPWQPIDTEGVVVTAEWLEGMSQLCGLAYRDGLEAVPPRWRHYLFKFTGFDIREVKRSD